MKIGTTLPISITTGWLLYLNPWLRLALIVGDIEYHVHQVRYQKILGVTMLNTLASVLAICALWMLAARFQNRAVGGLLRRFLLTVFVLTVLRSIALFVPWSSDVAVAYGNLWLILSALLVTAVLSIGAQASSGIERALLRASAPLSVVCLAMLIVMSTPVVLAFGFDKAVPAAEVHAYSAHPRATATRTKPTRVPRIVWVILDEFDASIAYGKRPDDMKLPHIDRFANESVNFEDASSTSGYTITAVPSLLTGIPFTRVIRKEPSDVILATADADTEYSFRKTPNVIDWANEAGVPVSLVGWTHPYCRLFGDRLVQCAWYENEHMSSAQTWAVSLRSLQFRDALVTQLLQEAVQLTGNPCSGGSGATDLASGGLEDYRTSILRILDSQRARTIEYLRSGAGGLTILHLATPHPPGRTGRTTPESSSSLQLALAENYAVADRMFGEIRSILEDRNEWDSALVILTSDHGLRSFWGDWGCLTPVEQAMLHDRNELRVPLMVKFPGANAPRTITRPVETTMLAPLVHRFLEQGMLLPEEQADFLDGHSVHSDK
ncbi:MAG: LTA synthase family protein [Bryobacterales bacterium]|nr:LTA synthase family protein [Bryobacterales bacterium]